MGKVIHVHFGDHNASPHAFPFGHQPLQHAYEYTTVIMMIATWMGFSRFACKFVFKIYTCLDTSLYTNYANAIVDGATNVYNVMYLA